jgi:PBP1b-binding outer membrane lipoprotein LpoB
MKFAKMMSAVLSAFVVVIVSAGCGAKTAPNSQSEENTKSSQNSTAQEANPFEDVSSSDAFAQKLNLRFDINLAEKKYAIISGKVAEIDGVHGATNVIARAQKTQGETDVSGDFNSYKVSTTRKVGDVDYALSYNETQSGVARWFAAGVSYSVQLDKGASAELLLELATSVQH